MSTDSTRTGGIPSRDVARRGRITSLAIAACIGLLASLAVTGSPAEAYPPDPPDPETSRANLDALVVETEGNGDGYDRDLFPHWDTVEGSCDTRETVLQRDGSGVEVDDSCQPTTGSWYSVYDAVWVTDSSDVDIDHIVALAEAWKSGADGWDEATRRAFANDLTHSQLIAVSQSSNASKSDNDPAEWVPTNTSVHCIYAREWIDVKHVYGLSVDDAEKTALHGLLDTC